MADGVFPQRHGQVLGRVIICFKKRIKYEAEPRHAELIVEALGMTQANAVKTPGEDEPEWRMEDGDKLLEFVCNDAKLW